MWRYYNTDSEMQQISFVDNPPLPPLSTVNYLLFYFLAASPRLANQPMDNVNKLWRCSHHEQLFDLDNQRFIKSHSEAKSALISENLSWAKSNGSVSKNLCVLRGKNSPKISEPVFRWLANFLQAIFKNGRGRWHRLPPMFTSSRVCAENTQASQIRVYPEQSRRINLWKPVLSEVEWISG